MMREREREREREEREKIHAETLNQATKESRASGVANENL